MFLNLCLLSVIQLKLNQGIVIYVDCFLFNIFCPNDAIIIKIILTVSTQHRALTQARTWLLPVASSSFPPPRLRDGDRDPDGQTRTASMRAIRRCAPFASHRTHCPRPSVRPSVRPASAGNREGPQATLAVCIRSQETEKKCEMDKDGGVGSTFYTIII